MTRVVVDTETTGLGPNDRNGPRPDGIVSVGIAWRDRLGQVHQEAYEARPDEVFLEGGRAQPAFQVNGFTEAQVRNFPDAKVIAGKLKARLRNIAATNGGEITLAAFNADFDKWFLEQEPWNLQELGAMWEPCLMRRSMAAMSFDNGHLSLAKAIAFAGLVHRGPAHHGEWDAEVELRLSEWLDEHDRLKANAYGLEDIARDIRDFIVRRQTPPPFPNGQDDKPDIDAPVFASMLDTCPREEWRKWHGAGQKDWGEWRATVGASGKEREAFVLGQLRGAGLHVVDEQRYVEVDGIGGKIDGRLEWPPNSGTYYPIEIKSVNMKLARVVAEPKLRNLLQLEVYLRATGHKEGFFVYTSSAFGELGQIILVPRRQDDGLWGEAQLRAHELRRVRGIDVPEPICLCGRCR